MGLSSNATSFTTNHWVLSTIILRGDYMNQLSKDEKRVLRLIPKGSTNPRPQKELVRLTGFNARKLRLIINELIVKHGIPIGAQYTKPNGYYIVTNEDERGKAIVPLVSQYGELFKRAQSIHNADLQRF